MLKPRLVAMSGPLAGTVRAITDDPLCLGRDAANQVRCRCQDDKHVHRSLLVVRLKARECRIDWACEQRGVVSTNDDSFQTCLQPEV